MILIGESDEILVPEPTALNLENDEEDEDETLMSGKTNFDDEKPMSRYPRLNIYYATSTSTSTSYTGTSTLATLDCTPTSYSLSAC